MLNFTTKQAIGLILYGAFAAFSLSLIWIVVLWLIAVIFTAWFYERTIRRRLSSRFILVIAAGSPYLADVLTDIPKYPSRFYYVLLPFLVFTLLAGALMIRRHALED